MRLSRNMPDPSTLVILLILIAQSTNGLRILGLFPIQMHSHFIMCQELMRGLAEKGHHVDVYSHFPLKTPIKNYLDHSLQGSELIQMSNNVPYEAVKILSQNIEVGMKHWLERHQGPLCNLLGDPNIQKLFQNSSEKLAYDLVITEVSIVHCFIPFGRHLNVPVVGVVTLLLLDWQYDGFGTPINLAVDRSLSFINVPPFSFWNRLYNAIGYHRVVDSHSKLVRQQDQYVEKYFGPGLPNSVDLLKDVSLVLLNHDVSLYGMMPFAPKVVPVGGLHVVDHNDTLPKVVQDWLDNSKNGCIYFSFGSMAKLETFPKHIIDALYKTFENIKPVRVLLKIAKSEELPAGLPSNVLTQSWFQQIAVLKHKNVKAFISHGGLMGTQEAIYYGVPMVVVPLFADQFHNAETYSDKKIAIKLGLSNITEESFTYAVKEILNNPLYRESMKRVSQQFRDHPLTPMDTAIYWIEYIHRHGKNALKSPVEDLMWWQKSLLDVYAFLGGSILIILFFCKKIIEKLIFFCSIKANMNMSQKKKIK